MSQLDEKVKSISYLGIEKIDGEISKLLRLNIMEFYLSEQKFIDLIEIIRNHKSLDSSQKIYYLTYLFLKSEVNELNFLRARDGIIKILENYNINFEDKFFFSNGYKILKFKNSEEQICHLITKNSLPERWNYWLHRWEVYREEFLYQNILNIFTEIIDSITHLKFLTYKELINIDLNLLTTELKKITNFTDLLKVDKIEELKSTIKKLNSVKNDIKKNQKILQQVISNLVEFFKNEFSLEKTIDLLFKELDKRTDTGLKLLDLLSDIIYLTIKVKNPDISPSLFKILFDEGIDLNNTDDLKKFLKERLIEMSNPNLEEYTIFYAIRNIQIISKIPSFHDIHFFNRKIDETYTKDLGTKFPKINHWARVSVKAKGINEALYHSENILKKYQNFGILKDFHFKHIRKNYLVFKNNKSIKTSLSIEDLRLYTIKALGTTNGIELRDFVKKLEFNLEKVEFQRINALTELIIKIENTFDITDQLAFLWIILETLTESELYREEFAKILTIIDEVELQQQFYMAFFPIVQNNWDDFKKNYLSQTKSNNFPKEFSPKFFIDSLDILSEALNNNYMKQKIKEFSVRTPRSHYQRIKLKEILNSKLLINIYKYRNQYFHSGFYDPLELRKIIPILHRKLIVVVESYIFYLIANKNKKFKDFKMKWINTYELFLEQLYNHNRYSECFPNLLDLIESFP